MQISLPRVFFIKMQEGEGKAACKGPTPEEDRARELTMVKDKDRSQKSKDIASTPAHGQKGTGAVTPGDQQISKRVQQFFKKKREEHKRKQ